MLQNGHSLPYKNKLIKLLRSRFTSLVSIVQNNNPHKTNVILGKKNAVLWGKDHIVDYIGDLKFKISPLSFFQVNPIQTAVLTDKAVEYANLTGKEEVIDAYCGIGTISLLWRERRKSLRNRSCTPSYRRCKDKCIENNIHNAEFIEGQAEVILPTMVDKGLKVDVAVVDPPRKTVILNSWMH